MSFEGIRAKRDQWRAEGLCYSCGAEAAEGHKLCEDHLRYHRMKGRERRSSPAANEKVRAKRARSRATREAARRNAEARRSKKRDAGVCVTFECVAVATVGELCEAHADPNFKRKVTAASMRALHARRRAAGLCVQCGWPNDRQGVNLCTDCRDTHRDSAAQRSAERRANGLCSECGKSRPRKHAMCARCRATATRLSRRRRAWRKSMGLCMRCDRPRTTTLCDFHRAELSANQQRRKLRRAGIVFKEAA